MCVCVCACGCVTVPSSLFALLQKELVKRFLTIRLSLSRNPAHFTFPLWYLLSDFRTAIYTRLKLPLFFKSTLWSGLSWLAMLFLRHLHSVNDLLKSLYNVACMFGLCTTGSVLSCCGWTLDRSVSDKECLLVSVDMTTFLSPDGYHHTFLDHPNFLANACL